MNGARRLLWAVGRPFRSALILSIRAYRMTLGSVLGGQCRFYPSCSVYAESAIRDVGALRGIPLAAWRVLRCHPYSRGGVDLPPRGRSVPYDTAIHPGAAA